jgi:hypothetical protein
MLLTKPGSGVTSVGRHRGNAQRSSYKWYIDIYFSFCAHMTLTTSAQTNALAESGNIATWLVAWRNRAHMLRMHYAMTRLVSLTLFWTMHYAMTRLVPLTLFWTYGDTNVSIKWFLAFAQCVYSSYGNGLTSKSKALNHSYVAIRAMS